VRAAVFHGPGDVRVEEVPDPRIEEPTDAVVRVTHAAICGSDLWAYRGDVDTDGRDGQRLGHEWLGVVEEVGPDVETLAAGDSVLAPFAFSDGTCEFCLAGLQTSCPNAGGWGGEHDGGQGEAVRSPFADATLVKIPQDAAGDAGMLGKLLPLTDVMGTGHHAAVSAGVEPGGTAVVVGDGAVGLCGVLASARLGAERIIVMGHHEDRLGIAKRFGATEVVEERGEEGIERVVESTGGGAPSVLECVGMQSSMDTALAVARPGGREGFVGIPIGIEKVDIRRMYSNNLTLRGGLAPVRAYIPELLGDVLDGRLDPSPVLDMTVDLDGVPDGYRAMTGREAIKVMIDVA
jgi:threonine dehydrogenase-like Zn-dependent dehydrogenase